MPRYHLVGKRGDKIINDTYYLNIYYNSIEVTMITYLKYVHYLIALKNREWRRALVDPHTPAT